MLLVSESAFLFGYICRRRCRFEPCTSGLKEMEKWITSSFKWSKYITGSFPSLFYLTEWMYRAKICTNKWETCFGILVKLSVAYIPCCFFSNKQWLITKDIPVLNAANEQAKNQEKQVRIFIENIQKQKLNNYWKNKGEKVNIKKLRVI